jgi:hypothetical protein
MKYPGLNVEQIVTIVGISVTSIVKCMSVFSPGIKSQETPQCGTVLVMKGSLCNPLQ